MIKPDSKLELVRVVAENFVAASPRMKPSARSMRQGWPTERRTTVAGTRLRAFFYYDDNASRRATNGLGDKDTALTKAESYLNEIGQIQPPERTR